MSKLAWLIEDTGRSKGWPHWLRIIRHSQYETKVHWTDIAANAMRFARKEDAESFWFLCPQPGIIPTMTEHAFDIDASGDCDAKG